MKYSLSHPAPPIIPAASFSNSFNRFSSVFTCCLPVFVIRYSFFSVSRGEIQLFLTRVLIAPYKVPAPKATLPFVCSSINFIMPYPCRGSYVESSTSSVVSVNAPPFIFSRMGITSIITFTVMKIALKTIDVKEISRDGSLERRIFVFVKCFSLML